PSQWLPSGSSSDSDLLKNQRFKEIVYLWISGRLRDRSGISSSTRRIRVVPDSLGRSLVLLLPAGPDFVVNELIVSSAPYDRSFLVPSPDTFNLNVVIASGESNVVSFDESSIDCYVKVLDGLSVDFEFRN